MNSVKLYQSVGADITVDIEARFEDDCLLIDGYDIGKSVKEYWGDSDYEYCAKISPEGVGRLYEHFGVIPGNREGLLKAIASQYHSNTCYSAFLTLLDRLKIKYECWSWS